MTGVENVCLSMNIYISTFQRETKYMDNKKKALKARNDYLLGIESANASINRYFADDCSDLMDVSKNIKLKDLSICQS